MVLHLHLQESILILTRDDDCMYSNRLEQTCYHELSGCPCASITQSNLHTLNDHLIHNRFWNGWWMGGVMGHIYNTIRSSGKPRIVVEGSGLDTAVYHAAHSLIIILLCKGELGLLLSSFSVRLMGGFWALCVCWGGCARSVQYSHHTDKYRRKV
jgi:hypothetical protein